MTIVMMTIMINVVEASAKINGFLEEEDRGGFENNHDDDDDGDDGDGDYGDDDGDAW